MKIFVILNLLATASALQNMRTREDASKPSETKPIDGSIGGVFSHTDDYYYGGVELPARFKDYPGIVDNYWQRPWNLVNGACSETNEGQKYNMEIRSVAGGAYYLGEIYIGTPPQPMNMILDTGSDEIVIKGKGCEGCKGHGYNLNVSTTGVKDEQGPNKGLSQFAYGSGPVVVQRVNDTVSVGQFKSSGQLGLQVITDTTISFFKEDNRDALHAIVGMAPGMKEYIGNTLASQMEVRTFSECLPRNPEENGFFVVNDDRAEVKEKHGFSGPFKGIGEYYWAASVTGLRLEWDKPVKKYQNKDQIKLYNKKIQAIVDTGTSLLSMPREVLNGIQQSLQDLNFDCLKMKELPMMRWEIENVTHELAPEDYVAISDGSMSGYYTKGETKGSKKKVVNDVSRHVGAGGLFFHKPGKKQFVNSQTGLQCMLLFTDPLDRETSEGAMAILGMPFFREYEISFDFCTKEMFTKRSKGDCSRIVGQRPSNKQWCTDKSWFGCWLSNLANFFEGFIRGLVRIFSSGADSSAEKTALKIKPEALRLSSTARWLLESASKDGMVAI